LKVLLTQDINRLGRMGEVVEVAHGYARNYLIPRGLAVGVARSRVKEIAEHKRVLEIKAARQKAKLEELAERIKSKPVVIKARCSASSKLFGSITNRQLASEIGELTGEEIDRHKITVDERIRSVGMHHATLKLHPDVEIDIAFEVEGEGFVAEEPEEEPGEPEAGQSAGKKPESPGETAAAAEEPPEPEAREIPEGE